MEEERRSNFWSTVPGILTGLAALISAATGGYLAISHMGDAPSKSASAPVPAELKPAAAKAATPSQSSTAQAPPAIAHPDVMVAAPPAPHQSVASGQPKPAFDCARASTQVENMICTDTGLAARDRRAAALYFALRNTLTPELRAQLLQSQKRFLDERSNCSTSECLSVLYDVRLRQLAEFDSGAQAGAPGQ